MIVPLIILVLSIIFAIFNFMDWKKRRVKKEIQFDGGVSTHMLNLLIIFMIFISFIMMIIDINR